MLRSSLCTFGMLFVLWVSACTEPVDRSELTARYPADARRRAAGLPVYPGSVRVVSDSEGAYANNSDDDGPVYVDGADSVPAAGAARVADGGLESSSADESWQQEAPSREAEDFVARPADFECVKNWERVRSFRVTNKAGRLEETLEVAREPGSAPYPVGTILQLIPQEAMVKRREGWNAASNDWEFFFLAVERSGTEIVARGSSAVMNGTGGRCMQCHSQARAEFDLVCESDHGCEPLDVATHELIEIQNSDPRCH